MWYDVSIGSCEVVRFSLPDFHSGHTGSNPVRNTPFASLAQLVERRNHNS